MTVVDEIKIIPNMTGGRQKAKPDGRHFLPCPASINKRRIKTAICPVFCRKNIITI